MAVVDVDAVRFENLLDLVHEALPGGLNSEYLIDLIQVIGSSFNGVDVAVD